MVNEGTHFTLLTILICLGIFSALYIDYSFETYDYGFNCKNNNVYVVDKFINGDSYVIVDNYNQYYYTEIEQYLDISIGFRYSLRYNVNSRHLIQYESYGDVNG